MDIDSNQFSEREKDVVKLLLQGKSNKQIALELGISVRTVEFHLGNIYAKLGVTSRTEAVLKLSEERLWESTGEAPNHVQGESTVDTNGETTENGVKLVSRRFPVRNLFYIISGGLLATIMIIVLVLANQGQPTKNPDNAPTSVPTSTTVSRAAEEAEIRDLVENFGKRLQTVSLQAPDAAQEIQDQYSEFVEPALLEVWTNDVLHAPGRIVSSPWPDRIEISTMSKEGSDRYVINGFVIEVTSLEVANGGAAARMSVRIVVQNDQGHWLIAEYAEER